MRQKLTIAAIVVACGTLCASAAEPSAEVKATMAELWRRGTCLLSSVLRPAERETALPRDVGDTPVLRPYILDRNAAFRCYAADGETLWLADDQVLHQVAAGSLKPVRRFDRLDGLSEGLPLEMAAHDGKLYLACTDGLSVLDASAGKITPVHREPMAVAKLAVGGGAWLASDAGCWHLPAGQTTWRKLPDFPGHERLARSGQRGFWWTRWIPKTRSLLPAVMEGDDGLYVLCLDRLVRFDPAAGKWLTVAENAWDLCRQGRTVWVMLTQGVLRYDPATGKTVTFTCGKGPAAGRPVAMTATDRAFFLLTEPTYEKDASRFVGGGISRLDVASGEWTVTDTVDGNDCRFASAILADGGQVWVAATLYDKVVQLGAHPGMAHVKRWRPHASGLALLHWADGKWSLQKREGLKTAERWIMGQKGTVRPDRLGPERVDALYRIGDRLWGLYRIVPERYYSGYFFSGGLLAARDEGSWAGRFDVRTAELGLAGERPQLMLISHSHGHRIVLAHGHPRVLGFASVGGHTWAVCESGLSALDKQTGRFRPVLAGEMRFYWRATAAAANEKLVYIGGDGGTVSQVSRANGQVTRLGVARGRRIVAMACSENGVVVRTAPGKAVLPPALDGLRELPAGEYLAYDGRQWTAAKPFTAAGTGYGFGRRSNYLTKAGRRVAFVKDVFRPKVLCADPDGGLWLGSFDAVVRIVPPAN